MDSIVNVLSKAPEFLKHGILGVAFFLFIVSGYLLYLEQKKDPVRKMMLVSIFVYMFFTLLLFSAGLVAELKNGKQEIVSNDASKIPEEDRQKQNEAPIGVAEVSLYDDGNLYNYIKAHVEEIKSLDIAGAHLQNGVAAILAEIRRILSNGGKVRITITDPTDEITISRQTERGSAKKTESVSVHQVRLTASLINQTIIEVTDLNAEFPSNPAEIRLLNAQMDERIHVVTLNDGTSEVFLKLYPYKQANENLLFGGLYFKVERGNEQQRFIYDYYANKFNSYFNSAVAPSNDISQQLAQLRGD
ncbi:hypothetical protein [uncultured Imperialibacter sp.]|uniref:hypothetical protein n=1 Tax=uncultured Imperialibacter sp. TaxID=1672639 RepID=UPI0030DB33BA|tara:strand:- start:10605 stop:11513 length:909 start_codon:yes stop_codon:yes gene_type:complete